MKLFCDFVRKVTAEKRDYVSEGCLGYLARLLDLFALLDAVKNMKACLNNDFAFYKRCVIINAFVFFVFFVCFFFFFFLYICAYTGMHGHTKTHSST